MRHGRGLVVVMAVVFLLAIVGVQVVAHQANQRDADNAVASCERGNQIRDYLAFDNDQRIARLHQQLANPAQITEADAEAFRGELLRRAVQRERLVPFDCDSLR